MDSLTSLLHAFYTHSLPPQQRQALHAQLLSTLQSPQTLPHSLSYLTYTTTNTPDPLTLHFALHAIEHAACTSFSQTPPSLRSQLFSSLTVFLTSAYTRNTSSTIIPQHLLHKAAHTAIHLGSREWLLDSTHSFPRTLLSLIDQNGHTPDSLPPIFSGMSLITALVDFTTATHHTYLRAAQTTHLTKLVRGIADGIVSALEIGIRINGPHFPKHVAVNAVRSVAQLVHIQPAIASEAVQVLKRCVEGRCDQVGTETLAVLAEIVAMGGVKVEVSDVIPHVAAILERVAMGEITAEQEWGDKLMAYAEAVVRRALNSQGIERVLNGMMGVTMRWEGQQGFERAVQAWISVLEAVEDEEIQGDVWQKVCVAVSEVCVRKCLDGDLADVDVMKGEWEKVAAVMSQVAEDVARASALVFIEDEGQMPDHCVEAMVLCARLCPDRVGPYLAEFVCRVMQEGRALRTGAYVAYCLAPILRGELGARIFEALWKVIEQGAWRGDEDVAVALLRAAGGLLGVLHGVDMEVVKRVGGGLIQVAKEAIGRGGECLATAGAAVLLGLDQQCRDVLFTNAPPVEVEIILQTRSRGVAAMGIAGMTRWALVPPRDAKGLPVKWTEAEWHSRQAVFGQLCERVFVEFLTACGAAGVTDEVLKQVEHGAGLLLAMVLSTSTVHGRTKDVLWEGGAKKVVTVCVQVLGRMAGEIERVDFDVRRAICGVMAGIVSAIGCVLENCRRQMGEDGTKLATETVQVVLRVAGGVGNARLGRAALNLIRDEIAMGREGLVESGVKLAVGMVAGEPDVTVAAVGVLTEALKQHWLGFWPGDAIGGGGDQNAASEGKEIYFAAINGIVQSTKSEDLAVCRAGLLSLQTLHAARRLYARKEAFRVRQDVVGECVKILTDGRESLGDEAVEVVYGIACVDFDQFWREIGGEWEREHNGFVRGLRAFAKDYHVLQRVKSGLSL